MLFVWDAHYGRSRAARTRRPAPRRATDSLSLYSRGRISRYEYRAIALARAARQRVEKHFRGWRQRSSDLSISRRFLWQLQTLSRALCGMARRSGFDEIPRKPDGQLSLL